MKLPVLSQAALHQAGFGRHCFLTVASLLPQVSAFTNHTQLLPWNSALLPPRNALSGAPAASMGVMMGNGPGTPTTWTTTRFPSDRRTTFTKENKQVSSWFPVEVIWDQQDWVSKVWLWDSGASLSNGVRIYDWGPMGRITSFIYELFK